MKIRVYDTVIVCANDIEDEKIKKLLRDNGILFFNETKEKCVDVDLNRLIDKKDKEYHQEDNPYMGFLYCNRLYEIVRREHCLRLADDTNLKYEIIEEGFPDDIPYCEHEPFENVEEMTNWLHEEFFKENESEREEGEREL